MAGLKQYNLLVIRDIKQGYIRLKVIGWANKYHKNSDQKKVQLY